MGHKSESVLQQFGCNALFFCLNSKVGAESTGLGDYSHASASPSILSDAATAFSSYCLSLWTRLNAVID